MKLTTFAFISLLLQLSASWLTKCSEDTDCPAGEICDGWGEESENLYCFEGCRSDSECPSGWECDPEYDSCEVPDVKCSTDNDCSGIEGALCDTRWGRSRCQEGCRSDSDCPSGQLCNDAIPNAKHCDEDFCRDDGDCDSDSNERCIETDYANILGKTCEKNGCRSDADCYKDEACVKTSLGYKQCRSREDCAVKGCDQGRLCLTVNLMFLDLHKCTSCEEQEKYCDVDAVLNTLVQPILDVATVKNTGEPVSEEEKQRIMDLMRKEPDTIATAESCQTICMGNGEPRTPNPTASPTPAPTTPNPTPSPTPSPTPTPYFQKGGDAFLEFGKWRVGVTKDEKYFSFCHADTRKTAIAFKKDGTHLTGASIPAGVCLWDASSYANDGRTPINVLYGKDWIQFGDKWRLGATDASHASIAYQDGSVTKGATAMIWRDDGNRFPGPRKDFSTWKSPNAKTVKSNIAYGDKYIQFGMFRMGEIDDSHFSIWRLRTDKTAVIYRADGLVSPGNGHRTDFNHEKPFMGRLNSWNNFEGHATFDKPRKCDTLTARTKCTACPAHWYSSCSEFWKKGVEVKESWEGGCGFLGWGCKLTCSVDFYDYGCGCFKQPYNLNGLKICQTTKK